MKIEKVLGLGYTKDDILHIKEHYMLRNYTDDTLYSKIVEIYLYLLRLGFIKKDVLNITRAFTGIFSYDIDTLGKKISDLIIIGYSYEEIKKMIKENPKILSVGIQNIKDRISDMQKVFGYKFEEVIKMTKRNSSVFEYNMDTIKRKINDLINLGYSYEEVKKIIKSEPLVLKYDIEYIKKKIDDIMSLGYKREEVLNIIFKFPAILTNSVENMRQKILGLINLGYTMEQIFKMTKILPSLFGCDIEKIKLKKEFMESIGLQDVLVNEPIQFIQSVELTYARYMFYKSKDITITMSNYQWLFMNQKRFEKRFGITNSELIKRYNYNEDYNKDKKKV